MNSDAAGEETTVKLADRRRFGDRPDASATSGQRRDHAAGEVIVAQSATRSISALVLTTLQLGLLHRGAAGFGVATLRIAATVVAYLAVVAVVHLTVRRRERASPALVTGALAADLLFVYALTILTTTPEHYERALFGTIAIVHIANFFFGQRQARRVVLLGLASYVALIASAVARGLTVDVAEEVWTLVICAAGVALIVLQLGDARRRLRAIVRLFESAEQGDFSREYDAMADGRPDAITRVGLAYNAVRAQLASMVLTDPLTGCLNRRGFDQALGREIGRATRAGSEFALLAVDLDHFKHVNDTFGHLAGDDVLRAIGALLSKAGRAGDVVARVGGEEFAILLADTGATGAQLFAQRLCESIAEQEFSIGTHVPPVTITTSIGLAVGCPRNIPNFADLLWSRADDALYAAKRAGRNTVRAWTSGTRHSGQHVVIGSGRDARTTMIY